MDSLVMTLQCVAVGSEGMPTHLQNLAKECAMAEYA